MTNKNKRIFQTWLLERLQAYPKDIAAQYGDTRFTFEEIDRQSNIVAHWIVEQGLEKETFIGIYSTDRIKLLVSVIGVLKSGCVFVPLDPALPVSRLENMVETAELQLILTDDDDNNSGKLPGSRRLTENGVQFVPMSAIRKNPESAWEIAPPNVEYQPEDKIYVYFTSGTTGSPKAIVGRNKSLHHFITWEIETFNIARGTRVSQLITPGFDAFLRDVFVAIGAGGVICIPGDKNIALNPETLSQWIEEQGINLVHCVPSVFRLLVSSGLHPNSFPHLKFVMLSGEPVPHSLLEPWYDAVGERVQLVNFYGPSETTMIKMFYLIGKDDLKRERIPIGQPMKGCRVVILDENMNVCDQQVAGELFIRTPFRTHGYYNETALTGEKFIPNPLSGDPGDIVFRTGDLARTLPDGNIEFLGRKDRQVKIRGVRVELEDVEAGLLNYPDVHEAAVVKTDVNGNEMLCAFITRRGEHGSNREIVASEIVHRLREYLSANLPDYMIPSHIKMLEEIPRKPNGKIDYQALPDPFADEEIGYMAPRTPSEHMLVEIWQEILGVETVGIRHGFFQLGGNSLNIISLIALIQRDFNIKLGVSELFAHDTVEKQAELLKRSGTEQMVNIEPAGEKAVYKMSSVQRRLFFLQQVNSENMSYNMPRILVMEGRYDLERLKNAFSQMIERHEILRTSFHMADGEPGQKVHSVDSIQLEAEVWDLDGRGIDENGDIAHDAVSEKLNEFLRPFDLGHAPLMRVGFIRLDDTRLLFMMDTHHIVSDGISQAIFIRDYISFYNGVRLEPLRIHYKDYAEWTNRPEQLEKMQSQEDYWLKRMAGNLPLLNMPVDFERPATQTFEGKPYVFMVEDHLTRQMKILAADNDATLFIVLLAVYNVFLTRLTGQEDIIVGASLAGRRHPDLDNIIGMFINALAMRNFPSGEKTFMEFLTEVKENTLNDFENQDYQYENLLDKVNVKRVPGRNPLFDTMLLLNNEEAPPIDIPGLKLNVYPRFHKEAAQMDFKLRFVEVQGRLLGELEYSTRAYRDETAKMFVENFLETLVQLLQNPGITIDAVTLTHGLQATEADTSELSFDF